MYELPLFPLNTVLFPGMPLSLQIFEDRYKLMLQRALAVNRTFGVALIRRGQEASGPLAEPYPVGCTARIIQVDAQEDGRYLITVVGDERFRILRTSTHLPYLTGFAESFPLEKPLTLDVVKSSQRLRARVNQYLALLSKYAASEAEDLQLDIDLSSIQLPEDPLMLVYLSAALLQIPAHEKQPLLEAETAAQLLAQVQRLFRRELAVLPPLFKVNEEQASALAQVN